jgi:predicted metal-dependent enzyme (double-stranded beta helix superfamily)
MMRAMFEIDEFLAECINASNDTEPRTAIKMVLERAIAAPQAVASVLPPERAELVPLHVSPTLTVLKVVWTPGMTLPPHDHTMWAAIGIYTGGEDNAFFRPVDGGLAAAGGRALRTGDTLLLGHDVIHAVTNPTAQHAGAIHIYGGDLFAAERSEWDPVTEARRPYDVAAAQTYFEDQNRSAAGGSG